ncbi:hypothetical protein [Albidovulum sp.]
MSARLALAVAVAWPVPASAMSYEAREAIECVAQVAAFSPESAEYPPANMSELDAETLAYRAAAIRLAGGNASEVDTRIRERARSLSSLRMNLDSPEAEEEDRKETERARLGSLCNDLGERLPETRPFFLHDEADQ